MNSSDLYAIIAFVIGLIIGIVICTTFDQVFAEEYKFNMTSDLLEEERQLQLCIEWKIENISCGHLPQGFEKW